MRVIYSLHQHILVPQQPRIGMVLPERVFVTVGLFGDTQSLQRFLMSVCFEMVDHTAADYAIDKAMDLFRTTAVVGDEMQMLEHNDVAKMRNLPEHRASSMALHVILAIVSVRKTGRRFLVTEVR